MYYYFLVTNRHVVLIGGFHPRAIDETNGPI